MDEQGEKIELEFHIPTLGNIRACLHKESADLYRLLEIQKEIQRLKEVDHLGVIRFAYESAHHSRWEYIVLLLSLIDRCKGVEDIHLSDSVKLPSGNDVSSGFELLKCWALLTHIGHLKWTFTSERALMLELGKNKKRRREYLKFFQNMDTALKTWAQGVLEAGDIYHFYQTIAFFRLHHFLKPESGISSNIWLNLLKIYVLKENQYEKFRNLFRIYQGLRRAAYLGLDTHYAPALVNLNLAQIFTDNKEISSIIYARSEENGNPLSLLEKYLYERLYLAERSLQAITERDGKLREKIRDEFEKADLMTVIDKLAKGEFQKDIEAENLEKVVRLWISAPEPFGGILLPKTNLRDKQMDLESEIGKLNKSAKISVWTTPYGTDWVLQSHASPNSIKDKVAAYIVCYQEAVKIWEKINKKWGKIIPEAEEDIQDFLFSKLAREFIEVALNFVFGKQYRWEWKSIAGLRDAIFTKRQEALDLLKKIDKEKLSESKSDELLSIKDYLSSSDGEYVIVAISNLVAYSGKEQVAEFDGVIIEIDKENSILLSIIETKHLLKPSFGEACKSLEEKMEKIPSQKYVNISQVKTRTINKEIAYAFVKLAIPLKD